jgi:hypothetical protein
MEVRRDTAVLKDLLNGRVKESETLERLRLTF